MKRTRALTGGLCVLLLLTAGCPPAPNPPESRLCEGYACTEAGAKKMLAEFASGARQWSPAARRQLDALFEQSARKMAKEDALTPEGFRRARKNLAKIVQDMPKGIDDAAPRAIERVRGGHFFLCPIWPFC